MNNKDTKQLDEIVEKKLKDVNLGLKKKKSDIEKKVAKDLEKKDKVTEKKEKVGGIVELLNNASDEDLALLRNKLSIVDPKKAQKNEKIVRKASVGMFNDLYITKVFDEKVKVVRNKDTGVIVDTVRYIPIVLENGDKAEINTSEFYFLKNEMLEIIKEEYVEDEKEIGVFSKRTSEGDYTGTSGVSKQKYKLLKQREFKKADGKIITVKYNTNI